MGVGNVIYSYVLVTDSFSACNTEPADLFFFFLIILWIGGWTPHPDRESSRQGETKHKHKKLCERGMWQGGRNKLQQHQKNCFAVEAKPVQRQRSEGVKIVRVFFFSNSKLLNMFNFFLDPCESANSFKWQKHCLQGVHTNGLGNVSVDCKTPVEKIVIEDTRRGTCQWSWSEK